MHGRTEFTAFAFFGPELPKHVPFLFVFAAHALGPALMVLAGFRWVREAGEESGLTGWLVGSNGRRLNG